MAQDFKKNVPEILSSDYSKEKYFFMHTNTQRTKASYLAFVEGLFDNTQLNDSQSNSGNNLLLRVS